MGSNLNRWTDEDTELALNNYDSKSTKELYLLFSKFSKSTVRNNLHKIGLKVKTNEWTPKEDSFLLNNSHMTCNEQSKYLNRTVQAIAARRSHLQALKSYSWSIEEESLLRDNSYNTPTSELNKLLPRRTKMSINRRIHVLGLSGNRYEASSKASRKYTFDFDFFNEPNIMNSGYAGFIAADGCIVTNENCVKIGISSRDISYLYSLKEDINYDGPIKEYTFFNKKINGDMDICVIELHHKDTIKDLKTNFNIVPRKTFILNPPVGLSLENSLAYIVGYIDGDGSISIKKNKLVLSLCGASLNVLVYFKKLFDKLVPTHKSYANINKYTTTVYEYKIGGKRAAEILGILYELPITKLERKWNKVRDFLDN